MHKKAFDDPSTGGSVGDEPSVEVDSAFLAAARAANRYT